MHKAEQLPPAERDAHQKIWTALINGGRFHHRVEHADFYTAFGSPVPEGLQLYNSSGRFRDAILAHELKQARDEDGKRTIFSQVMQFSACVPAE